MSYCRWTDGDVYAYESDYGVQFWIAGNKSLDRVCRTHIEAYQYAKELRDVHGVSIPDYAIETLREESVDERERLLGIEVGECASKLHTQNIFIRNIITKISSLFTSARKSCGAGIACITTKPRNTIRRVIMTGGAASISTHTMTRLNPTASAHGENGGQMTNEEWLEHLAHNDIPGLAAWFDAEHVETEERALDGDTAALNARINELRAHEREWRVLSKQLVDERELYREALSQLLDTVTDGMGKVSALLDNYDEGMA